jgi:hypothetical protein
MKNVKWARPIARSIGSQRESRADPEAPEPRDAVLEVLS